MGNTVCNPKEAYEWVHIFSVDGGGGEGLLPLRAVDF